jgi:hypothetical protein
VEVTVERETAGRLLVTLATDEWEVHVRLSETDIPALVGSAHWHEHGTMQAGQSAGAAVFWASDGKQATLLIGNDARLRALQSPSRSESWMRSSAEPSAAITEQT